MRERGGEDKERDSEERGRRKVQDRLKKRVRWDASERHKERETRKREREGK